MQAENRPGSWRARLADLKGVWADYRRILELARPRWRRLVAASFFLLIGSGMGLAFPQGIRYIIDGALEKGSDSVNQAAIILVVIFFIQSLASSLRHYLFTIAGHEIVTDLRADTYRAIMRQEVGFFDKRKTGELMSRLSSDATVLQNTVSVNISMTARHLVMAVGGTVMLVYMSPTLAGLILLVVPPLSLGAVYFGKKIGRHSRNVQDALARAGEVAEETISGLRTVRAFSQENHEASRYQREVLNTLSARKRYTAGISLFQGIAGFAGFSGLALVFWYGGGLVVSGAMSIGELTAFVIYAMAVTFSLGALGSLWTDFVGAYGAAERIFEILDRNPSIPLQEGQTLKQVQGRIQFEDIRFSYPTRPDVVALSQVNLSIEPGEIVALVGPSGGGKSTIVNLLTRFYDPTSGRVCLDGQPLTDLDASWLRDQIGIVPQEPMLFSTSIGENIAYGRHEFTEAMVQDAARVANAHEFIETFPEGYATEVGERGVRLSGGQKQRIAIARAVLKDPKILILDEATSALDAESEHLVKQALDRLMQNRTTLVIAHRLSTVRDAHRVVVIDNGHIVETGSHDELMQRDQGLYRKLVEHQFIER